MSFRSAFKSDPGKSESERRKVLRYRYCMRSVYNHVRTCTVYVCTVVNLFFFRHSSGLERNRKKSRQPTFFCNSPSSRITHSGGITTQVSTHTQAINTHKSSLRWDVCITFIQYPFSFIEACLCHCDATKYLNSDEKAFTLNRPHPGCTS